MKIKKHIFLFFIFCNLLFDPYLFSQDPQFSQFYANPLYLASSFAGSSKSGTRIALNYRNQWPVVVQAFQTYNVSFDHYFPKIRSGAGIYYLRDVGGSLKLTNNIVAAHYSYDFQVSHNWHVRPGLSFAYLFSSYNFNNSVTFEEVYEESINNTDFRSVIIPPFDNKQDFDFSASVMTYNNNLWLGLNVDHFLQPNLLFYKSEYPENLKLTQVLKYSLFGGVRMRLRGNLLKYYKESLTFAFNYKQQHKFKQLDVGTYYHLFPIVIGVWYRGIPLIKGKVNNARNPGHDAVVFLLGYKINSLNIGYSFDFTISQLQIVAGGAHELSFVWDFEIKQRQKKPEALPCPDI